MCHNVYVALKNPRTTSNQNGLAFRLEEVNEWSLKGLQSKFNLNLPYIYYLGSTSGCSCDLHIANIESWESIFEHREPERDRVICLQAFYDFLQLEAQNDRIELYSCWDGDEELPIETTIEFDTQTLSLETFVFLPTIEKQLIQLL
jgi:hypothetical protein